MKLTGAWLTKVIRDPSAPNYRDLLLDITDADYQAVVDGTAHIAGDSHEGLRLVKEKDE